MQKMIALASCLALAACATPPPIPAPVVQIVKIPSAAPYRYIHYSSTDDARTIAEVRRHNYVHSQLKKAEAEALATHDPEKK